VWNIYNYSYLNCINKLKNFVHLRSAFRSRTLWRTDVVRLQR
jgi:hypothetical protein